MTQTINISEALTARKDRYAKAQNDFILGTLPCIEFATDTAVWEFLRKQGGKTFRVVYQTKGGTIHDWVGRQGVHNSEQDGTVANIGHSMASAANLTLSFWTATHGDKVNTGTGKGYRTLRAAGILAFRVGKTDYITPGFKWEMALRCY